MSKSVLVIDMPNTCGECPFAIYTADEKRYIGYCNTSDEDYYCKALNRFMEYDKIDGGVDILGKPIDCPLEIFEPQPKIDKIIKRIEQTRDKDKLCEYPYNRCIDIVREVLG
jgi:hypothetical protein